MSIKSFNEMYKLVFEDKLFESITDPTEGNTQAILTLGSIPMYVKAVDKIVDVELKPIVNAVNGALAKIASSYDFMYLYIMRSKPQYVLANPLDGRCIHKTMAVDDKGNLWMNVHFIYNELDCDKEKIFGILFHELMHNFLDHLERGKKFWPLEEREALFKTSPQLWKQEDRLQNICADYEVNCDMVADGVVTKDFWKSLGGWYDEKYHGKFWEEIYRKDKDLILKAMYADGHKLPDEYFELLKEIMKAIKVLKDKKSTEREKSIAKEKLKDLLDKLFGKPKVEGEKMTIRERLIKLQRTRIKEIGEIGPCLKSVIDDLLVSPKSMNDDDLSKFINDVEVLKNEMIKNVEGISDTFGCPFARLESDIEDCMNTLSDGVKRINQEKTLTMSDIDDITAEIIFKIDRLLADTIKKRELDKKRKEEKEEKMKKKIEELKSRHILHTYVKEIKKIMSITEVGRVSDETSEICGSLLEIVEPLLEEPSVDGVGKIITSTGKSKYDTIIEKLSDSLYKDLKVLIDDKTLFDRDDEYIKKLTDKFKNDNIKMFGYFSEGLSETDMISRIKITLSSLNEIEKEILRKRKVRPSEEYLDAYTEEYNRLKKIYLELGKKGLREELGC